MNPEPTINDDTKEIANKKKIVYELENHTNGYLIGKNTYENLMTMVHDIKRDYAKYLQWNKEKNTLRNMHYEFKAKERLALLMNMPRFSSMDDMCKRFTDIMGNISILLKKHKMKMFVSLDGSFRISPEDWISDKE